MREIKYRGKSLESGQWVYGSLVNNLYRSTCSGEPVCHIVSTDYCGICSYKECDSDEDYFGCDSCFVQVDPKTVGQYIGHKDINSQEIYSGDVVNVLVKSLTKSKEAVVTITGVIEYRADDVCSLGCGFGIRTKAGFEYLASLCNCTIEVVGNIYENELPKVEKEG